MSKIKPSPLGKGDREAVDEVHLTDAPPPKWVLYNLTFGSQYVVLAFFIFYCVSLHKNLRILIKKRRFAMIEQDTIKLLRECDAGIKMGVSSIKEVLDNVKSDKLREILIDSLREHEELDRDIQKGLDEFGDDGKDPNPMAASMSWIKTNVKLMMHESDKTIADLMTDGCDMGVKSLSKYLNQYKAADERSKDIAKKLIKIEQKLADDIRGYL